VMLFRSEQVVNGANTALWSRRDGQMVKFPY